MHATKCALCGSVCEHYVGKCSRCYGLEFRRARKARREARRQIPISVVLLPSEERRRAAICAARLKQLGVVPAVGDTVALPDGARPARAMAITTVHEVERHTACKFYDDCLDHAERKNWANFHCGACPHNRLGM